MSAAVLARRETGDEVASAALAAFAEEARRADGRLDPVALFHAVRRLPYRSTGDRSLAGILAQRAGSCSSKHILLAALLRRHGIVARVVLAEGDFAAPLAATRGVPQAVVAAAVGGIPDIHNVVRAVIGGRVLVLDATWHDAVKRYGFRVNDTWSGEGDTEVALDVERWIEGDGDIAAQKSALIGAWPAALQARRRRFLEAINNWVDQLGPDGKGLGGPS
jgi:hypothetical protein